jgi:hypothetical protein
MESGLTQSLSPRAVVLGERILSFTGEQLRPGAGVAPGRI